MLISNQITTRMELNIIGKHQIHKREEKHKMRRYKEEEKNSVC
jgi:hypothetical protein